MSSHNIINYKTLESYRRIDPEYYQKKFFKIINNLENNRSSPLSEFVSLRKEKFKKDRANFNYIEISKIDTLTSALENSVIDTINAPSRAQNILKTNDLIVSFVRPNRKALSIITKDQDNFVGTSGLGVYKIDKIEPEYLLAYLKTNIINSLVSRKSTATEYPAISNEDFITTPVIIFKDIKDKVNNSVIECQKYIKKFKTKYEQANEILYESTGFKKYKNKNTYKIINSKKVFNFNEKRIDPKFHCIDMDNFFKNLSNSGSIKKIKDLVSKKITNGVSPKYDDDGEVVLVNSEHLGIHGLNFGATDRVSKSFFENNQKAKINFENVLVYATGAYYGRSNIYLENRDTLAGLDTLILQFDKEICDPYYASLYLNSDIGLTISKKYFSGSAQEHLYDRHINEYPIYIPDDKNIIKKISNLVKESYDEKQNAFKSLEIAINLIEKKLSKII
jgi:restriction endonuclease S subunit